MKEAVMSQTIDNDETRAVIPRDHALNNTLTKRPIRKQKGKENGVDRNGSIDHGEKDDDVNGFLDLASVQQPSLPSNQTSISPKCFMPRRIPNVGERESKGRGGSSMRTFLE